MFAPPVRPEQGFLDFRHPRPYNRDEEAPYLRLSQRHEFFTLFSRPRLTSGKVELFQKNLDAMEEEGKVLESRLSAAVARSQKQLDKNALIDQCLDLYENHILQLEGGCERALNEALRALGVEVIVDPDKKEGGIEVNPFVHSVAG